MMETDALAIPKEMGKKTGAGNLKDKHRITTSDRFKDRRNLTLTNILRQPPMVTTPSHNTIKAGQTTLQVLHLQQQAHLTPGRLGTMGAETTTHNQMVDIINDS